MPNMIQVERGNPKKKQLQRWDRLTDEQQDALLAHLSGGRPTAAQKKILAEIGTVLTVYSLDDDGEILIENLATGKSYKHGQEHGVRARDKLKKVPRQKGLLG